ncbi:PREDICTED: sister chromatid cohesion 1 protein 2 isoform X2 [Nelumbo nucifera]|uniref:Sister chromatid cohesion 1 protein 2 isoform X2 n=1 Tax=Nelumbo nucifera TaxID=4432 RepID=A0A1U7ZKN4_NELNU|nr:PREDICTED: sister chromatid cohesion 1 protein 2 isoform X2 [Nelumbo nucifera]
MFYSQTLLSRKGPLRTIWIAAYCHKKLKKDQIAETDISSSVDKIILDEVTVTYRVLGFLLLGVVRIYSRKVDYLYHDCNEVLIKINSFKVTRRANLLKEAAFAPYVSITLPDTFELDAFDLEIVEDVSGSNVRPHDEIVLEAWEEDVDYSLNKYHHKEVAADLDICTAGYTPIEDVLSPYMLDFNMDSLPYHYQSNLEESMEKLRCNLFPQEEQLDHELYCGAEEPLDFVAQFDKTDDQEENLKFLEIPPLDIGGYDIFTEGHPIETTPDKTSDKTNFSHPSGAVTPGVMVIPTPSKKEQARRPRKRRSLFDEMIVLPNEVLRQSIHDSSSLVAKRRKVPHTALDAWRNHKISSLQQNFSEPLFPYISSELKILFYNNNLNTPEPAEDAEGPSKLGEVKFETPRDSVERRPIFQENSIDHSTSAWSLESPTYVKPNREEVPIPVARVDLSPSETQDLVLSLMDEEIGPYEENNSELGGCSVRTSGKVSAEKISK